jgi:hypothetical protein
VPYIASFDEVTVARDADCARKGAGTSRNLMQHPPIINQSRFNQATVLFS